jgi:Lipocalin-like domain
MPLRSTVEKIMTPSEDVASQFVGSWSLMSWTLTAPDGRIEFPYGEDAVGCIIYTAEGQMAAHLMRRQRDRFRSDNRRESTPEERAAAFLDYLSYCGPYTLQPDARTVTHHVEACSFPNWVGTNLVRTFRFEGDSLTLLAALANGAEHVLVWKRN